MSKLIVRPVENASNFAKALVESKKPLVADHGQLARDLNYGKYGTTMIKPNPYKRVISPEHHKLRGVLGSVRMYQIINKLESPYAKVYKCPYFSLHFYPPGHFMGLARKSSPAVHIHYRQNYLLNGNLPGGKSLEDNLKFLRSKSFGRISNNWNKVLGNSNSLIPRQWAYFRVAVRKLLRPVFYESWNQYNAPDGLFLYKIEIFSDKENEQDYKEHIEKSVKEVSKLDLNKFVLGKGGENWVEEANSRVKINTVNNLLRSEMAHFRYERVPGQEKKQKVNN